MCAVNKKFFVHMGQAFWKPDVNDTEYVVSYGVDYLLVPIAGSPTFLIKNMKKFSYDFVKRHYKMTF